MQLLLLFQLFKKLEKSQDFFLSVSKAIIKLCVGVLRLVTCEISHD